MLLDNLSIRVRDHFLSDLAKETAIEHFLSDLARETATKLFAKSEEGY